MHQNPRPSPRSSTPATNPTTNPERTNNPRDQPPSRSRSSVDLTAYTERAGAEGGMAARHEPSAGASQDKETVRLNQIIQQFHTKSALMICGSRASLPPAYGKTGEKRQNRWFNIVVDETDVLVNDLQEWRRPDLYLEKPSPLVIEIYLDMSHLPPSQALLCVDENGRSREVTMPVSSTDASPGPFRNGRRYREIVVERWTIELGDDAGYSTKELNEPLPSVYKKGIVAFRSLYSSLRMLPAWKLCRQLGRQTSNQQALRLRYRIRQQHELNYKPGEDPLTTPLFSTRHGGGVGSARPARDTDQPLVRIFEDLLSPVGPLQSRVAYRDFCEFRVASSESVLSAVLLSSEHGGLLGAAGRSLPEDRTDQRRDQYSSTEAAHDRPRGLLGPYGSLGTFHNDPQKRGTTATADHDEMKRNQGIKDEAGASPPLPPPGYFKNGPLVPTPSPRTKETWGKQPLSHSPRPMPSPKPSPHPIHPPSPQYASASTSSSKRTSLNALPQQQLRNPSSLSGNEIAVSSTSSSPRPAQTRYSSSFANRPRRWTSQSSKAGESGASSGGSSKEKLSHPTDGSSGDARTDDDDIASFISDLERSKDIKFATPPPSRGGNVVNLAKFSSLRDGSSQLADEMSSSSLIQTSSTPPSRRLSNVPGLSTSSSPSRGGIAGHAPYVRSRLSTHSIMEAAGGTSASPDIEEENEEGEGGGGEDVDELPFTFQFHD